MSLISRLKAVVAGDEYLDDDFDELDYASEDELNDIQNYKQNSRLFKQCRALADSLKLPDCSMGMSGDWEEAIDAGSTWLRLGSLIFGGRS